MKVAINCFGDAIVKDECGTIHIFRNEEWLQIGKAYYKWVQHKQKSGVYIATDILGGQDDGRQTVEAGRVQYRQEAGN
jgi:hypothetical protein